MDASDLRVSLARLAFVCRSERDKFRGRRYAQHVVDRLFEAVLPHVSVGGRRLDLEDLVFFGLSVLSSAPYPFLHSDQDWTLFPEAAGFQIWALVEPSAFSGEGNLFVATTPELLPGDPPTRWDVEGDGAASKNTYLGNQFPMPLKVFANLSSARLSFGYADLDPGEVLVFSKRTLHMSDPRPHLVADLMARYPDRLAVSVRAAVVADDEARGVPFWPAHSWTAGLATDKAWADAWMRGGAKVDGSYRLHAPSRHDWLLGIPRTPGPWKPPEAGGGAARKPPPPRAPAASGPWPAKPARSGGHRGGRKPPRNPDPARRGENALRKAEMEAQGLKKPEPRVYTAEEIAAAREWARISAFPPETAGGDEMYDDELTEFRGNAVDRFANKYSPIGGPFNLNPP